MSDPACGAGALLLAFANECKRNHINYQTSVFFVAQDIDFLAGCMPNWAFGTVKVTGTREGVKSFVERFISSDDQSTVPGKRFFARSFSEQKREQSVKDAMEEFEGKADNETAEHSFLIMFAWSVWSCMIDGYPSEMMPSASR